MNGDGYADVIIGAPGDGDRNGRACLYLGSTGGLSAGPTWEVRGDIIGNLGQSVAGGGDVNGDGYPDVLVGAYQYDHGQVDEGRAYRYLGSAEGLSEEAAWSGEGNEAFAIYGASLSLSGDVNGDGYSDAMIGAPTYYLSTRDQGRALHYLGRP